MPGPPPKPSALKRAQGTYRACRAAPNEMSVPPGVPEAPAYLDERARAEWDRVVPQLVESHVLSKLDGAALEGYCQTYSMAVWYQRLASAAPMVKTDKGPRPNPAAAEARRHWALVKQFLVELGLTPSARTRVSTDAGSADETESFLFGKLKVVTGGRK